MESKDNEVYTYVVEDGQFSFEVEIPQLLGKVGDYIRISLNGADTDGFKVKIVDIDGWIVVCSGSINEPI